MKEMVERYNSDRDDRDTTWQRWMRDKTMADMDERYNVAEMAEIQRGRYG